MKFFLLVFLMTFLAVAGGYSQSADSTSSGKKEKETQKASHEKNEQEKQAAKLEGFVDRNGNGIDDRVEQGQTGGKAKKGKGRRLGKDQFVDKDGDGICDGKESAIGLRKLYRKRRGNPGGK